MNKIRVGIIGTGNIGTDLLMKSLKSKDLEIVAFVGRRADSEGILKAQSLNVNTSTEGLDYFIKNNNVDVVFDCTDAFTALKNWNFFKNSNIKVIDMTPSKIGEMCIPIINGDTIKQNSNVNMVTCGGQSSIPLLNLISNCCSDIEYIEIVSQIASKSAGIATRLNIDQYIHTTEDAIYKFTNCKKCKVILNLNPAEPCVDMQTTMFVKSNDINFDKLQSELNNRLKMVREYVPHYELVMMPVINEDGILILSIKVRGTGDYLPSYAGNLDIINCAAVNVAERLKK
jgi:acetaldehyde dehydrogenase (acetylating)